MATAYFLNSSAIAGQISRSTTAAGGGDARRGRESLHFLTLHVTLLLAGVAAADVPQGSPKSLMVKETVRLLKCVQSKLTQAFLWTLFAGTLTSPSCFGMAEDFHSLIEDIKSINPESQMLLESTDVAQRAIDKVTPNVPEFLRGDFESACEQRLRLILQMGRDTITPEYTTVMMSQRLVEFSECLVGFEYFEPFTNEELTAYREQVSSLLATVEASVGVSQEVLEIATRSIKTLLQRYQWDVFRPEFGRPLDAEKLSAAHDILDNVVERMRELTKQVENAYLTGPEILAAARIGREGSDRLDDLFESQSGFDLNPMLMLDIWLNDTAELKQSISDAMPDAEQLEIAEMDRLSDEEAEAMRRENDPATIMAKNRAVAAARHEQVVAQLRSQHADKSSWRPFVFANILFFLVAGGIFLWRRRTS